MSESSEQRALFQWATWNESRLPCLKLLFHVPNGGQRHVAVATKLKAEGVKPGVPDIILPVPQEPYHGLFIEMKYGKNKPSKTQQEWLEVLRVQGYYVEVCWSWIAAADAICMYLGEDPQLFGIFLLGK